MNFEFLAILDQQKNSAWMVECVLWYKYFKALSTRIWIFLNPQLLFSGLKYFPVHTQRIQIEFASPPASDGVRIHSVVSPYWFIVRERLDTILLRDRIRKYPGSPSTRCWIHSEIIFFHSGERMQTDCMSRLPSYM